MMKLLLAFGLIALIARVGATNKCEGLLDGSAFSGIDWSSMSKNGECVKATKAQIQMEMQASYAYLAMAAHFSKDIVNRPGFANFFFAAAAEERGHGMKLVEYMLMRGELTKDTDFKELKFNGYNTAVTGMQDFYDGKFEGTGLQALQTALKLEVLVTKSIKKLIKTCEIENETDLKDTTNDYHFVDYLTGEFLEEQYHGQRDLAGKISTLSKMMQNSPSKDLAEFLFDKKNL